jgi:hypothetical protein
MRFRVFVLAVLVAAASSAAPLGTEITYQGVLSDAGSPATGVFDFRFVLFDAADGGAQIGPVVLADDVSVTDGRIAVNLDFGPVFDGTALWLEIGVREGASTGSYTLLSPRQTLTAAPFAQHAQVAETASTAAAAATAGHAATADSATTAKAVPAAVGTLMGALARNSSGEAGAEALLGALTRDHDGGLLNNLSGYLSQPDETTGNGILKHVLAGNRSKLAHRDGLGEPLDAVVARVNDEQRAGLRADCAGEVGHAGSVRRAHLAQSCSARFDHVG